MQRTGQWLPPVDAALPLPLLILSVYLYRAVNAVLVCTYFNPDEYWQSLEVAHRMAFGSGHLTWEWAPENKVLL